MLFSVGLVIGKWVDEGVTTLKNGNFSLPTSQQPVPLISFGQNIVDKGDLVAYAYGNWLNGTQQSFAEITPSILYGINDKFSLFVELPIAVSFKSEQSKSRGVQDLVIQLEGVVYAPETASAVNEITVLANIGLPTGSATEEPLTGLGSSSFFLGFTASHTDRDWYYFMSLGGLLKFSHQGVKFGNEFLYEFGLSKNISYRANKWILNWMIELNGFYTQHDKISGITDRNSGGNVIILGPSLFFSTQRLIVQGGISGVISEHLFGIQPKDKYLVAAYAGWKF